MRLIGNRLFTAVLLLTITMGVATMEMAECSAAGISDEPQAASVKESKARFQEADSAAPQPVAQPLAQRDVPPQVYKTSIRPHWLSDGRGFWYRNELRNAKREFILVDGIRGTRQAAFDHERLADALRSAGVDADAKRLEIDHLRFADADKTASADSVPSPEDTEADNQARAVDSIIYFRAGGKDWRCDLATYDLSEAGEWEGIDQELSSAIHPAEAPRWSRRTGGDSELRFVNRTDAAVELFWIGTDGRRISYGKLEPGQIRSQHTFAGHVWMVTNQQGRDLVAFEAVEFSRDAVVTGEPVKRLRGRIRSQRPASGSPGASPDGKWRAFVRDGNVVVERSDSDERRQLTSDGTDEVGYGRLSWSPNSQAFVAFLITPGDQKEVFLVESSPRGGGRAVLHRRQYPLPGDRFTSYQPVLFRFTNDSSGDSISSAWQSDRLTVDPIDFGRPRVRWSEDGNSFTYQQVDRGHQRRRLVEIDVLTGQAHNLIDEVTDTFIWTAHTQDIGIADVTWLEQTDELIFVSEADGWRHLYLIDVSAKPKSQHDAPTAISSGGRRLEAPGLKYQITKGQYVVRSVDQIDEEKRQIWFRASGLYDEQDPYLVHYCRVNFDGTGFVKLTSGDGDHVVQFAPEGQFFIDTYSRIDMPPVHELRRSDDGSLVCELEQADASELDDLGWKTPEVFSAPGRDGRTEIWGIICRPQDYDPAHKYPVIEDIYAGPHDSFVPKRFSTRERYAELNRLGFIVVKIDGMGTANRGKDFHDVCWHNIKDAGFPDRIAWMKAAGAKYPELDLQRVGIYGGSAGGQNAGAAVLFHGDFYKAAVAGCGCHDNRMDKASWNEQWMGYPVGPHYSASSNIDNAENLNANLLLIVGEMDTNVPPESTLRFADALIRADKDFDLIVVPGGGHGMGGRYGQRRLRDFFVEHLRPGS